MAEVLEAKLSSDVVTADSQRAQVLSAMQELGIPASTSNGILIVEPQAEQIEQARDLMVRLGFSAEDITTVDPSAVDMDEEL
ncbi:hypothetical protein KJ742_01550 [Patescibacteria group bacterium]|nr:hypothetical protein [Patescibacteria group bacterium]MBU1682609.1 hypothetical protein [Patescibacteria group bacterium]MBU1934544.1 hypothetical protein [Patescibacteria group bacterium]